MLSWSGLPNNTRVTIDIDMTINRIRTMWWVETNAVSICIARLMRVISANPPGAKEIHKA